MTSFFIKEVENLRASETAAALGISLVLEIDIAPGEEDERGMQAAAQDRAGTGALGALREHAASHGTQTEFPLPVAVCAWCKKPAHPLVPGHRQSHGICLRHLRAMRLQMQHGVLPTRRRRSKALAQAPGSLPLL